MSEERTRLVQWNDPSVTALAAKGRTGLAYLRAIADGTVPPAPIQFTLGFELSSVEEGQAEFRLTPGEHLCNPMGAVHGGIACTLLDSAMGCAVMSILDERHGYITADLMVHLTRGISPQSGPWARSFIAAAVSSPRKESSWTNKSASWLTRPRHVLFSSDRHEDRALERPAALG